MYRTSNPSSAMPLALLLLSLSLHVGTSAAADEAPPSQERIRSLIARLASSDFEKRESASKELQAIGNKAIKALRRAEKEADDPEVRSRARSIVQALAERWVKGEQKFRGPRTSPGAFAVAFSQDGKLVLTAGSVRPWERAPLALWELESGRRPVEFSGSHEGSVSRLAISPDGTRALSAGFGVEDPTVRFWDLKTGKQLLCMQGHTKPIHDALFLPDGSRALSSSMDGTVRLWELKTAQEQRELRGHKATVWHVAPSPDGRSAVSSGQDGTVRLWNLETGKELWVITPKGGQPGPLCFSPDGKSVLVGCSLGHRKPTRILLLRAANGEEFSAWEGYENHVREVFYAPDGRTVVTTGGDRALRLWDSEDGTELHTLRVGNMDIVRAAFTADGKYLLAGTSGNVVFRWLVPK